MSSEFNKIIKDLADKNTEKEKESKIQCESWITLQMQKKDDQTIDSFFEFIRTQASQSSSGSSNSQGAINAFGIFAHSIKSEDRFKEKYIPVILEILIECYFMNQNDSQGRVTSFHQTKKLVTSNLQSVIMIGQWLIYSKLPKILDVLFRMKKDTSNEMVTYSSKLDEVLYPIIKNDLYRVKISKAG